MKKLLGLLIALALTMLVACGGGDDSSTEEESTTAAAVESPTAPAASVSFSSPADGATVSSPVKVTMAANGVAIEPAADGVKPNSGHFHIIVDADCVAAGQVVPADATHIHYGKAQTEAELPLEPGQHTLCLQLADANHVATDVTSKITITVS